MLFVNSLSRVLTEHITDPIHQENLHVPTIFRFPIRAVGANSSAKSIPTVPIVLN
jgi:hypothetical protein